MAGALHGRAPVVTQNSWVPTGNAAGTSRISRSTGDQWEAYDRLPEAVRQRLIAQAGKRIAGSGELIITARRFRTQERNRADALERLIEMIREAARPPAPPRRATRPTLGSKLRRLDGKKQRGAVKSMRGKPDAD